MRKVLPACAMFGVVLADRRPLPLSEVGPPEVPRWITRLDRGVGLPAGRVRAGGKPLALVIAICHLGEDVSQIAQLHCWRPSLTPRPPGAPEVGLPKVEGAARR